MISSHAYEFSIKCDKSGYIVGIHPSSGHDIDGKCLQLITSIDAKKGVAIVEIVIDTVNAGPCHWKPIGGVWGCY